MITKASQEVNTTGRGRSASATWSLTTNLTAGEHTAVFPIAHPNCHAGVQGTVFKDGSNYRLILYLSNDSLPGYTGSPNFCDGTLAAQWQSAGTAALTLQSTPRYLTFVQTSLPNPAPSFSALASALLIDSNTGSTILFINNQSFTAPQWFNTTAKRFGMGALRNPTSAQIPFDDFSGSAS